MGKKKEAPAVTVNAVEAEALNILLHFEWEGEPYTVDVAALSLGQWAWAHRRVTDESLSVLDRLNALIDMLEVALGKEQTRLLLTRTPQILDDAEVTAKFWEAFVTIAQGVTPGE